MDNKIKSKSAFTLAEVLITLVIIGVVAALTIPTAINRMQREELRSQFKKAVSVLYQVVQKMKADNGDLVLDYNNDTVPIFRERFMSYFHVTCKENCVNLRKYRNFNDTSAVTIYSNDSFFTNTIIVQDGMTFGFSASYHNALYIIVDINGPGKKPNRLGYDVFGFFVRGTQIYPCEPGEPASTVICSSTSSAAYNGYGCTKRAISDENYFKNLP